MSGQGGEEEEDGGEDKEEAVGPNRLRPGSLELLQVSTLCPTIIAEYGDCNGRTLTYDANVTSDNKDDSSPDDDADDDVSDESAHSKSHAGNTQEGFKGQRTRTVDSRFNLL